MGTYRVAPFYESTFAKPFGLIIWRFLNEKRTIGKMEAASFDKRPAVESLMPALEGLFSEEDRAEVFSKTCKRMIGHMAKQVLEGYSYQLAEKNVSISDNGLFLTGARYERQAEVQPERE